MKKFTILAIALCATIGTYAQYSQGRMLAGGSVEFSTTTSKVKGSGNSVTLGKSTSFSFAPQFGYFIIDNLAVGASLDLSLSKWKDEFDDDDNSSSTSIEIQPTVRYYLPQNIFFQAQVGLGTAKEKEGSGNVQEFKYNTFSWAIAAGYAFFLNDNVALEPILGYGAQSLNNKDNDVKFTDGGLFLRVGLQVYLGNK